MKTVRLMVVALAATVAAGCGDDAAVGGVDAGVWCEASPLDPSFQVLACAEGYPSCGYTVNMTIYCDGYGDCDIQNGGGSHTGSTCRDGEPICHDGTIAICDPRAGTTLAYDHLPDCIAEANDGGVAPPGTYDCLYYGDAMP